MTTFPRDHEKCATCAHWGGDRIVKYNGSSVAVNGPGDYGKCYAGTFSPVSRGFPACMQKCKNYEKWSALK